MQEFKQLVLKVKGAELKQVIKEIKSLGGDDAEIESHIDAQFLLGVDTNRIEVAVREKFPGARFFFSWANSRHGYV